MATFARAVPKKNQQMMMLPGNFSGNGWSSSDREVRNIVSRLMGSSFVTSLRNEMRVTIQNASSTTGEAYRVAKILQRKGYIVTVQQSRAKIGPFKVTRVIAEKGNPDDAEQVVMDLGGHGDIVNASVGDYQSTVTVMVGDDLASFLSETK